MEEKKQNDTEIDVGMIEQSVEREKYLTVWLFKNSIWKAYSLSKILDLIHRLQSENERLKEVNAGLALANLYDLPPNEDCLTDNEFEIARKTIADQKAEIELLTEELKYYRGELL